MRDEGLCRYIGMTGYPAARMNAAMTQTDIDVCLTYAHATLLDDTLQREIAPVAVVARCRSDQLGGCLSRPADS